MPWIAILVAVVLVAVSFALAAKWLRTLETRHPDVYESLGRPSFLGTNGLGPILRSLRFIVLREHASLRDEALSRVSDALLACFVAYVAVFFYILAVLPARAR